LLVVYVGGERFLSWLYFLATFAIGQYDQGMTVAPRGAAVAPVFHRDWPDDPAENIVYSGRRRLRRSGGRFLPPADAWRITQRMPTARHKPLGRSSSRFSGLMACCLTHRRGPVRLVTIRQ